jgi:PAT family beta-lactamase induction signal transducer AmpG
MSSPAPTATEAPRYRHPLLWVPSLYLAMGIPNVTVGLVSAIMYKNLGVSNIDIALYTSQLYLPWALKPLWSSFLEPYRTKRFWVLTMEFTMAALLGLIAFSLPISNFFSVSLAFFWIAGFASATQDIVADGIYMTTLPSSEQAKYMGIQGMCWNFGSVLASGLLVWVTGFLHEHLQFSWIKSWIIVMSTIGGLMALLAVWHMKVLPEGARSDIKGHGLQGAWKATKESWISFFKKKGIWMMLLVVFAYRFGEGFIEKFGPLFLIDSRAMGGLGLSNQAIGNIYGTLGTIGFIIGALLGGFVASKISLKRSFIFLAIALNLPHLTYYFLSWAMPHNLALISAVVTLEKFGFGFGSVGHMLYMMQQVAPGPFKMTHYAMATAVTGATKWATGSASGFVYEFFDKNYQHFFIFMLAVSIPPIVIAWFAPFPFSEEEKVGD